jgi:hypothetical protein
LKHNIVLGLYIPVPHQFRNIEYKTSLRSAKDHFIFTESNIDRKTQIIDALLFYFIFTHIFPSQINLQGQVYKFGTSVIFIPSWLVDHRYYEFQVFGRFRLGVHDYHLGGISMNGDRELAWSLITLKHIFELPFSLV